MDFWLQVLILAVLFDVLSGEPPVFIHPVVWMGKLIGLFVRRAPAHHRKLYGHFIIVFCVGVTVLVGLLVISFGENPLVLVIAAFLLKSTFSIHMLLVSAFGIKKILIKEELRKLEAT